MTIRTMTEEDLHRVLGWAAAEGWNPGREDAAAFFAADPRGFLVKDIDGTPVAAISVFNHSADVAFLGLYLCLPAWRGQGHGMDVWRAGLAHAGARSIGLDGVPAQQDNYARSGFLAYGATIRYEGRLSAAPDPRVRPVQPDETAALIAQDANACGIKRTAFATAWFAPSQHRQTMALTDGAEITGFATFRRCQSGTKIGPLCASTPMDAEALLASNPFFAPGEPVFVDVQGHDAPLGDILQAHGFVAVFETARMFKGPPPQARPPRFHGIATMELG